MKDDPYLKEMRMSGSVVNADSIAVSKNNTAIRRMAEPLMKEHGKGNVQTLNRISRIAEYLVKQKSR